MVGGLSSGDRFSRLIISKEHAQRGATKGGVSKCKQTQTQTNADKRRQTQANAEAKTQTNMDKRKQMLISRQGSAPTPWAGMHRVYGAQRGIETMVEDHGLGRGQTMG